MVVRLVKKSTSQHHHSDFMRKNSLVRKHETAYPCFKNYISAEDLNKIYTPTTSEIIFAKNTVQKKKFKVCFLILLKCVRRLGYFLPISAVPKPIVKHISTHLKQPLAKGTIAEYEQSMDNKKHTPLIREYLGIKLYEDKGEKLLIEAMANAAYKQNELVDIINIGIEELAHHCYEIPVFEHLVKNAIKTQEKVYRVFYNHIYDNLRDKELETIKDLLKLDGETHKTHWHLLQQEMPKPSLNTLKKSIHRFNSIRDIGLSNTALKGIPHTKIRSFSLEAKKVERNRIPSIPSEQMTSLALCLVHTSLADVIDNLCELLIHKMGKIHAEAKKKLADYLEENQHRMDATISSFKEIHEVLLGRNKKLEHRMIRIESIFDQRPDLIHFSENHSIYKMKNYKGFLWPLFKSSRSGLFKIINLFDFISTNQENSLLEAIHFAGAYHNSRSEWIPLKSKKKPSMLDLTWIPDDWWFLISGLKVRKHNPRKINRQQFEVCLISQIAAALKSGELCVRYSLKFNDFREDLLSLEQYHKKLPRYCEYVGFPAKPEVLLHELQANLQSQLHKLDPPTLERDGYTLFDHNEELVQQIANTNSGSKALREIKQLISNRLPLRNILEILHETQDLLNWCQVFRRTPEIKARLQDPVESFIISTFCYGCGLGPTQTSRSLPLLDCEQIAWLDLQHITEEDLLKATKIITDAYDQFSLPTYWDGSGSVSINGTKWNIHGNNILSEYQIKNDGYGGIRYCHVNERYLAIFSRFNLYGIEEAITIFDTILEQPAKFRNQEKMDIPEDHMGIFGLAYLLGIRLLPKLTKAKTSKVYETSTEKSAHNQPFWVRESINWDRIENHSEDLFRFLVSIMEGRISTTTALRQLSISSGGNKLYLPFRELGKAIYSTYAIRYLRDHDFRQRIIHATTMSESFHNFMQFVVFGKKILKETSLEKQRKIARYNHLVANAVIFMNIYDQTLILNDLIKEGYKVTDEILASLSPFQTKHINRW